jgi:hypothetical protein
LSSDFGSKSFPIEIGPREALDFVIVDRLWHREHEIDTELYVDVGGQMEIVRLKYKLESGRLVPGS